LANVTDVEGEFTDDNFKAALSAAYDALDVKDDGSPKKMGTTLTFLKFHKGGYTIAHIGDSRVYHIRPGVDAESTEILFQTQDHSLVNDLVRIGEMTPEEAKTSKQRNVITRAMQPNMERRSRADIAHANDIRTGDYFMLCSDGILEQMEDENIKFIFSEKGGDAERKVDMLIKVTENNRDNHTAILVRVDDVIVEAGDVITPYAKPIVEEPMIVEDPIVLEPEQDVEYESHDYESQEDEQEDKGLMSKIKPYITPALIVVGVVATGVLAYLFMGKSEDKTVVVVKEVQVAGNKADDKTVVVVKEVQVATTNLEQKLTFVAEDGVLYEYKISDEALSKEEANDWLAKLNGETAEWTFATLNVCKNNIPTDEATAYWYRENVEGVDALLMYLEPMRAEGDDSVDNEDTPEEEGEEITAVEQVAKAVAVRVAQTPEEQVGGENVTAKVTEDTEGATGPTEVVTKSISGDEDK
jgi:serine/threonine protein phosphatase PrpC